MSSRHCQPRNCELRFNSPLRLPSPSFFKPVPPLHRSELLKKKKFPKEEPYAISIQPKNLEHDSRIKIITGAVLAAKQRREGGRKRRRKKGRTEGANHANFGGMGARRGARLTSYDGIMINSANRPQQLTIVKPPSDVSSFFSSSRRLMSSCASTAFATPPFFLFRLDLSRLADDTRLGGRIFDSNQVFNF